MSKILLFSLVLLIFLPGCSSQTPEETPLEAYHRFLSELTQNTQFHLASRVTVEELSTQTYVASHFIEGYAHTENNTLDITYHFVPYAPLYETMAPISFYLFERNIYADLGAWTEERIGLTLEMTGETVAPATLEALTEYLLGNYFLVEAPFPAPVEISNIFGSFFDLVSENNFSDYVNFSGQVFTLLLEGDSFLEAIDPALAFLLFYGALETPNLFLHHGTPRQSDTMGLMEWFLDENADFTNASITWDMWQEEGEFLTELTISIPDWLFAQKRVVISPGEVPEMTQPTGQRVSIASFFERLEEASWELVLGDTGWQLALTDSDTGTVVLELPPQDSTFTIVTDLTGLNLFNHTLTGNDLLENRTMALSQGQSISVPIFSGDFLEDIGPGLVLQETENVQLLYMATPLDGDLIAVAEGFAELFLESGSFTVSPLRISEQGDMATLSLRGGSAAAWDERLIVFSLQQIPDSTYLLSFIASFSLFPNPVEVIPNIIALGELVGVDFLNNILGRAPTF